MNFEKTCNSTVKDRTWRPQGTLCRLGRRYTVKKFTNDCRDTEELKREEVGLVEDEEDKEEVTTTKSWRPGGYLHDIEQISETLVHPRPLDLLPRLVVPKHGQQLSDTDETVPSRQEYSDRRDMGRHDDGQSDLEHPVTSSRARTCTVYVETVEIRINK